MQCLYIVKGKFSWSGQACAGMIQSNPAFYSNTYDVVYTGEPGTPSRGCYIRIMRRFDSKWIYGTEVTMAMAAAEGWLSKAGSKWQTMPDQMLAYRAAAFFARVYCPTTFSGQTVEEVHDIHGYEEEKKTRTTLALEEQ
jgi:hypothetical protein